MVNKHQPSVFISSAIKGLVDLRSEIIEFFKEKKGYLTINYGDKYSSHLTGEPGFVDQCLAGVRSSDAFFLFIDKRYGDLREKDEDENSISLTELEYLEAANLGKYRYVFCRNEVWIVHNIWKTNPDMNFDFDNYDHPQQLMRFLNKLIEREENISRFDNSVDLKNALSEIELSVDSLICQPTRLSENENLEVSS